MKLSELFEGDVVNLAQYKQDIGIPNRRHIDDLIKMFYKSFTGNDWSDTMEALYAVSHELNEKGIKTDLRPFQNFKVSSGMWAEELPYVHLEDLIRFQEFLHKKADSLRARAKDY